MYTRVRILWLSCIITISLGLSTCHEPPGPIEVPDDQPALLVPGVWNVRWGRELNDRPAKPCAHYVRIHSLLPDPQELPDREGEWVRLINLEPVAVDLEGWQLASRSRSVRLRDIRLSPMDTVRIGGPEGRHDLSPARLRNRKGQLLLLDPCGHTVDLTSWGTPPCPGVPAGVVVPGAYGAGYDQRGPARVAPNGTDGGCGQI